MASRNEDPIILSGSKQEGRELNSYLLEICECPFDPSGRRIGTCRFHDILLHNPAALNRLLATRRGTDQLRKERNNQDRK